jgi:hypothetical protein
MHPKSLDDLNVTDLEIKRAKDLAKWNVELQMRAFFSLVNIEVKFNPKMRKAIHSGKFRKNVESIVSELSSEMGVEFDGEAKNFIKEILPDEK